MTSMSWVFTGLITWLGRVCLLADLQLWGFRLLQSCPSPGVILGPAADQGSQDNSSSSWNLQLGSVTMITPTGQDWTWRRTLKVWEPAHRSPASLPFTCLISSLPPHPEDMNFSYLSLSTGHEDNHWLIYVWICIIAASLSSSFIVFFPRKKAVIKFEVH